MTWIILTFISAFLESISNIHDRHILVHETRNPRLFTGIWGIIALFIFSSPAIFQQQIIFQPAIAFGGLLLGLLYVFGYHFYYQSVSKGEVSRIIPVMTLNPVIVLIFATIFLQEFHKLDQYLGMGLILIGVIITSIQGKAKDSLPKKAFWFAILASTFFASKSLLTKIISDGHINQLNLIFWIGLGAGLTSLIFLFQERKTLLKTTNIKFLHIFSSTATNVFASLLFTLAITIGPVSIISFLVRIDVLFVFIFAETLDFFRPKYLQEQLNRQIFIQKLIAVTIIMIGSYFLL